MDPGVREAVAVGRRPRIDVLELERSLGASLYDFGHLRDGTSRGQRGLAAAARRTGQWSAMLALAVAGRVSTDEVVYATGEDVGFVLAAVLQARSASGPALVVRLEEPSYGRTVWRRAVFDLHRHNALRRIDRLVCRTAAHLQYLHAVERVPMHKLAVVSESTDEVFFSPERALADPPGDLPAMSQPYIVAAGLEKRDYDTLVQAVDGLPVGVVIGAGSPWRRGGYQRGGSRPLPPNVTVSSFDPKQMRALYHRAAFVVVPVTPTLRACGMNVVLEGWAMGKAVIATRTAGLVDAVTEGVNGMLVEPYDVEGWRSAILRLLSDPGTASELGRAGRELVATRRRLPRFVATIEELLDSAARARGSRT